MRTSHTRDDDLAIRYADELGTLARLTSATAYLTCTGGIAHAFVADLPTGLHIELANDAMTGDGISEEFTVSVWFGGEQIDYYPEPDISLHRRIGYALDRARQYAASTCLAA